MGWGLVGAGLVLLILSFDAAKAQSLSEYLASAHPAKGAAPDASVTAAAEPSAKEVRDFGVLVDAPGVEKTYAYCTPCHSEMIIAQQGKTRKHWADLFEWMIEEQGMAEIEEPDRSIILDYLAANYNEDRPNFPRP